MNETHAGSWLAEYVGLLHDPAHWLFEITVTIVIDLVVLYFGYQLLWKRVVLPKLRRDIHEEIDREHELTHDSGMSATSPNLVSLLSFEDDGSCKGCSHCGNCFDGRCIYHTNR